MMGKQKNVPVLRFPGFEGEWVEKKLGKGVELISGQHLTPDQYDSSGLGIPYFTGPSDFTDRIENVTKWSNNSNQIGYVNDVLLTVKGSGVGTMSIQRLEKVVMGRQLMSIRTKLWSTGFLYQYLLTQMNLFNTLAAGNLIPGLSRQAILSIKPFFPTLPEQTKIASFLSAVDEKLQALKKKKAHLETYKKGLMQQLFSGALRFKDQDGKDFPDWEEKALGELTNIYDGTHQTPKYVEDGVPFYSVEHLTANNFQKTKFITEEVFEKENKRVKLEKNDILMTRIGDIGTSRYIDWDVRASFYVSIILIKQSPKFISKFLHHFISSDFFQRELWVRTIHVAFPKKINLGEIGLCRVKLPSLPEQTQIANFLSSIDAKINSTQTAIEQTESWKKGLLQKMFV